MNLELADNMNMQIKGSKPYIKLYIERESCVYSCVFFFSFAIFLVEKWGFSTDQIAVWKRFMER